MIIFKEHKELKKYLAKLNNSFIGFVPTMGGLHKGHEYLISQSRKKGKKVASSFRRYFLVLKKT